MRFSTKRLAATLAAAAIAVAGPATVFAPAAHADTLPGPAGPPITIDSTDHFYPNIYSHDECVAGGPTAADAALAAQLSPSINTERMAGISAEQMSCARIITQTVQGDGLSERAAVIAVMAAMTESTLLNINLYYDGESLGLFQMQQRYGWGTEDQIKDPVYATNKFISVMQAKYPNNLWTTADMGAICQAVEQSAFPDAYNVQSTAAQLVVDHLWANSPPAPAPITEPGQVRMVNGQMTWHMSNGLTGNTGRSLTYGIETDTPVSGDWDGNGTFTPGAVRIENGNLVWHLSNNYNGTTSQTVTYGVAGEIPVAGDWDGNGTWTPGVVQSVNGNWVWHISNSLNGTSNAIFTFGLASDTPIVGDWDGNGSTTPGVTRASGSNLTWHFSNSLGGAVFQVLTYGLSNDIPVVGDWDGNGTDTPGVVRSINDTAVWKLTNNLSGTMGPQVVYGIPMDLPVVGVWG